jgi:hypothetical protein
MPLHINEHYRELDLKPGADMATVRDSYRQLVKVWHPDRFAHDPKLQLAANDKLKRINHAYESVVAFIEAGVSTDSEEQEPVLPRNAHKTPSPQELYQLGIDRYYRRDYKNALDFFLRAAEMRYASAQYAVGFILYQHTTRNLLTLYKQHTNDNAAFEWFTKAAEQGHVKAQYMLGLFHLYAHCTPYNGREANRWLQRAASQGYAQAQERLSRMNILQTIRAIPLTKWVMEPPPAAPLPD